MACIVVCTTNLWNHVSKFARTGYQALRLFICLIKSDKGYLLPVVSSGPLHDAALFAIAWGFIETQ